MVEPLLFGVAVANPVEPGVLLKVAIKVSDEAHVANDVKFCTVLSISVPKAVNCWVVPGAMHGGVVGITVIEATGDVVSVVDPVMLSEVAVIMVEPLVEVAAVTRPCEPMALLIVAIPVDDESQVTDAVRFRLLLSMNVPVAVNCAVVPGAMLELTGSTERDTSAAGVGGSTFFVLQLTIKSSAVHTTTIHGRGPFCISSVLYNK
jgi:hypothetical protein